MASRTPSDRTVCYRVWVVRSCRLSRLFTDTEFALRNVLELKITLKIVVQYLRSTVLQPQPTCTGKEIQAIFDLLLLFVTNRPPGPPTGMCF